MYTFIDLNVIHTRFSFDGVYFCLHIISKWIQGCLIHIVNASCGTERPSGNPMCFVQVVNNSSLQYHCEWPGGTPQAQLSFPALSSSSNGAGNVSLTVTASDKLNGKTVMCIADHPVEQNKCNITASKF